MRWKLVAITPIVLLTLVLSAAAGGAQGPEPAPQEAQAPLGSAFTYQGQLIVEGQPANGNYDFEFRLFNAASGGGQVGGPVAVNDLEVQSGLFTTQLDFGAAAFNGQARWLEIRVRQVSSGDFTILSPRQALAPTPYALWSREADRLDGLDADAFARTVHQHDASAITSGTLGNARFSAYADLGAEGHLDGNAAGDLLTRSQGDGRYWRLTGNAGTTAANFLGTTDNTRLTLKVNGTTALRLLPTSGTPNLVGGYEGNSVMAGVNGATITGGGAADFGGNPAPNRVTDDYGTIGGGGRNQAGSDDGDPATTPYTTVGGGFQNQASGDFATVAGGHSNQASAFVAAVGGGNANKASGQHATVAGGAANEASGESATVGGGVSNWASGHSATVAGGAVNQASDGRATIGGGQSNQASAESATVGGGYQNQASAYYATVGGGRGNRASANYATIAGGGPTNLNDASNTNNRVLDPYGTVGGGGNNQAGTDLLFGDPGPYATVGGGASNRARGAHATIPGGSSNEANGPYSFAAGRRAKANNTGCFVWADSTDADVTCSTTNRFIARASGGFYFYSSGDLSKGAMLAANSGSWASLSDRAVKSNLAAVNPAEILQRLATVPIQRWSYTGQDPSIRHIGPMAQDFHAAFGVGEDERHISTVDADGVAFAAIQGLHQLVEEKDAEIAELKTENVTQEARIETLEGEVARLRAERGTVEARLAALESSATPAGFRLSNGLVLVAGVALAGVWRFRQGRATRRRARDEC